MTSQSTNPATSAGEAAAATVASLIAAISAADFETVQRLIGPDVVVVEPVSLPYGGSFVGAEAFFVGVVGVLAENFELGVTDVVILESGPDRAAAQMRITFTARQTGRGLTMPYVEVYQVAGGLVRHIEVYPQDTAVLSEFMATEAGLLSGAGRPVRAAATPTPTYRRPNSDRPAQEGVR